MPAELARPGWLDETIWPFPISTLWAGDLRVAYTDVGAGRPLLFLNAPQWSMVWRDVISMLQHDHRCVSFDAPGVGLSDRIEPHRQNLSTVRDATIALVDHLELRETTLVVHDLGGLAGLAAAAERPDAFDHLIAVNTFGWRPRGALLPAMLSVFGSGLMRRFDAATGLLPAATSGPLGVGRAMDRPSRAAFRRAFDRSATAAMHRMFADAGNEEIHRQASAGLSMLAGRPALSIFGRWGDYGRFRKAWRRHLPVLHEITVPASLHFPMNDNPAMVADAIASWIATASARDVTRHQPQ